MEYMVDDLVNGELVTRPATPEEAADIEARKAAASNMAKVMKWEAIKAERDRRRFDGGVYVNGHWFLSTETATGEYNSLILLSAGLPDTAVLRAAWRTMDGATVDMTPALVKQVLSAGFAQVAAIDDAAQAHRTAMESAADPGAYDFLQDANKTKWPIIFGE